MKTNILTRSLAHLHSRPDLRAPLQSAPDGRSALLAFPRWPDLSESDSLSALDVWLRDHPTCSVVLLNDLPRGATLRRLQKICKRRGCAYMVRAARLEAAAVAQ